MTYMANTILTEGKTPSIPTPPSPPTKPIGDVKVKLGLRQPNLCACESACPFFVLHYCYDSHHVLRLVVGFVADLRISQSSVVPKRLHCPWADVERLTHVLRVEPLVHGLVLTALTDSVHALHEVLQLGIKIVECLFLEYDESHTFLFSKLILCLCRKAPRICCAPRLWLQR